MKQANSDRKEYVGVYKRKLELLAKKKTVTCHISSFQSSSTHSHNNKLPTHDQGILDALEKRLDYWRIVLFRSLAEKFLEREKQFRIQKKLQEKEQRAVAKSSSIKESPQSSPAPRANAPTSFWNKFTTTPIFTSVTLATKTSVSEEHVDHLELDAQLWKELYAAVEDEFNSGGGLEGTHSASGDVRFIYLF